MFFHGYSPGGNQDAIFQEAVFQEAVFQEAVFQEAIFQEAVFQEAIFQEAIFQEAVFQEAIFQEAIFQEAIFQEANSSGGNIQGRGCQYVCDISGLLLPLCSSTLDNKVRALMKRGVNLPRQTISEFFYTKRKYSGLGLFSIEDNLELAILSQALRCLNSPDVVVRNVARSQLQEVVRKRTERVDPSPHIHQ